VLPVNVEECQLLLDDELLSIILITILIISISIGTTLSVCASGRRATMASTVSNLWILYSSHAHVSNRSSGRISILGFPFLVDMIFDYADLQTQATFSVTCRQLYLRFKKRHVGRSLLLYRAKDNDDSPTSPLLAQGLFPWLEPRIAVKAWKEREERWTDEGRGWQKTAAARQLEERIRSTKVLEVAITPNEQELKTLKLISASIQTLRVREDLFDFARLYRQRGNHDYPKCDPLRRQKNPRFHSSDMHWRWIQVCKFVYFQSPRWRPLCALVLPETIEKVVIHVAAPDPPVVWFDVICDQHASDPSMRGPRRESSLDPVLVQRVSDTAPRVYVFEDYGKRERLPMTCESFAWYIARSFPDKMCDRMRSFSDFTIVNMPFDRDAFTEELFRGLCHELGRHNKTLPEKIVTTWVDYIISRIHIMSTEEYRATLTEDEWIEEMVKGGEDIIPGPRDAWPTEKPSFKHSRSSSA